VHKPSYFCMLKMVLSEVQRSNREKCCPFYNTLSATTKVVRIKSNMALKGLGRL